MPTDRIAELRREYARETLDEHAVVRDPILQFSRWFQEAIDSGLSEPNAMTLATADPDGRPAARIVLLKGYDARGFVFFTNYASRKGQELALNPQAALLFHWVELERQLRIEGEVDKISDEESDEYYRSRPQASRIAAWASPQSQLLKSRGELEQCFAASGAQHGDDPQRPPHWGGYRVHPHIVEFWQGRARPAARPRALHARGYRRVEDRAAGAVTAHRLAKSAAPAPGVPGEVRQLRCKPAARVASRCQRAAACCSRKCFRHSFSASSLSRFPSRRARSRSSTIIDLIRFSPSGVWIR